MTKVSVIINIYNVENYVERCLKSVLGQTLREIDVICVNDGTPDNSMNIVAQYQVSDKRIRIVNNISNRGPYYTRWAGCFVANGEYVTFVDGDDYLPDTALEVMYNKAKAENADMVAGAALYMKKSGNEIWPNYLNYGKDSKALYKSLLKNEFRHNIWAKLFNKAILLNNKYEIIDGISNFDDFLFLYQVADNVRKAVCLDDIVYHYCQNESSLTQIHPTDKQFDSIAKAHRIIKDRLWKYVELRPLVYVNYQRCFIRYYYNGNGNSLRTKLKEYKLEDILSINNIIKYNSIKWDFILIMGKTPFAQVIWQIFH